MKTMKLETIKKQASEGRIELIFGISKTSRYVEIRNCRTGKVKTVKLTK